MKWNELYPSERVPSLEDIQRYIGEGASIWFELCKYIETTYQVQHEMTYSKCSAQPGWNIKYRKSGKSLCTMYPMEGYFIALVVVGAKEEQELEMILGMLSPYAADLYKNTPFSCGGRWLMIKVKDEDVLNDVKKIISLRVKPKTKVSK